MHSIAILIALVVSVSAFPSSHDWVEQAPRLVCYHTNWAFMRAEPMNFTPDQIDATMCTHLVYAFAKINPTSFSIEPYEPTDIGYPNYYKTFNDLKLQNTALKTLLSVGGWAHGSEGFSDMVQTAANRKMFIDDSINFLRQHDFDGLELHWLYPTQRGGMSSDKAGYTALSQELRAAYQAEAGQSGKERLLVTMAVPGVEWMINDGYEIASLASTLDFANLMSYDLHGSWELEKHHHTPLYSGSGDTSTAMKLTVDYAVNTWIDGGMPEYMLNLGFSLYGRSWMSGSRCAINTPGEGGGLAGDYTVEPGSLAYYEVCDKLKSGMTYIWDDTRKIGYGCNAAKNEWVGYDNKQSLNEKISYLKTRSLGGGAAWALDLDDYNNMYCDSGVWPLMSTLKAGIIDGDYVVPTPPTTTVPPGEFCVGIPDGFYPDPTDCHKFYQCSGGINYPGDCGTLAWNPICECCDHVSNVPGCV